MRSSTTLKEWRGQVTVLCQKQILLVKFTNLQCQIQTMDERQAPIWQLAQVLFSFIMPNQNYSR